MSSGVTACCFVSVRNSFNVARSLSSIGAVSTSARTAATFASSPYAFAATAA